MKKLVIGCANFGNLYGLNEKILHKKQISKIVQKALNNKIYHFDTAQDYKKSEELLGKSLIEFKKKKIDVDTKLKKSFSKKEINNIKSEIFLDLKRSIKNLGVKKINIFYLHNTEQLKGKYGLKIFKYLEYLKKKKLY